MIMAQHPQQHLHRRQNPEPAQVGSGYQAQIKSLPSTKTNSNQSQQQHLEQDGKRTLIKNQLHLIEQLQLENANLRNERDQLQLENEELKFQLQMISSSNILSQSGATFKNQQLEPLVESNGKIDGNLNNHQQQQQQQQQQLPTNPKATGLPRGAAALQSSQMTTTSSTTNYQQNKILVTPSRQPVVKSNTDQNNQQVSSTITKDYQQQAVRQGTSAATLSSSLSPISSSTTIPNNNNQNNGKILAASVTSTIIPALSSSTNSKLLATKSSSLTAFNVKPMSSQSVPQNRDLPQDDEEQRVKLVEQLYGDSEKVQAAAIIIQRAFRKYQICKRFRTITEQLRHTYQSVNNIKREIPRPNSHTGISSGSQQITINSNSKSDSSDLNTCAPGATRAAAWESLSYAASRLAASAAIATSNAKQSITVGFTKPNGTSLPNVGASNPQLSTPSHQQNQSRTQIAIENRLQQHQTPIKQDPVVAAAINFQQLESIRKRQYRVGLNIFNKNPEKGVSFLIAHSFIDSTSPYTKTSSSYYHSNQLHFMDKHYLLQHQLPTIGSNIQDCQLCCEEDNLKRNVAHFLLHRKGLAKEKIGQYLGNLQVQFNQDVLKYYLQELDFYGLQIDLALRKFLSTFRLPGEAQKIEKIVDCFAQRYAQCQQQQQLNVSASATITQIQLTSQNHQQNSLHQQSVNTKQNIHNYKNNLMLLSKDEIFILTFAIIMLNTDLHSPSLKPTSRMSASQFVNNLRGVFKSQNINESDLIEIYERVKANQITTTPDHVTHVMKVQQGLTITNFQRKELPNLCVPHRRLVCFCRLFEVYDINKKERLGQHQREIFLFNDLLLVTKLARRVRANTTQLYTYRQSISLQGLYVQLFQSPHYNFGIRLCQRSNDEIIIMFNARNELDQSRFVDDLGESIAEMDEMETIKAHNIIETIHFKYMERLRRHVVLHTTPTNAPTAISVAGSFNENGFSDSNKRNNNKIAGMMNCCDTRSVNLKQNVDSEDVKQDTATTSVGKNSKAKFSSMLNLSSATGETKRDSPYNAIGNTTAADTATDKQSKGLRHNLSYGQQLAVRNVERPNSVQVASASNSAIQRRCSTSSVHSLDSGLFLSRDVSPNQSS